MAGNARFVLNLGSQEAEFVDNYQNRPRGNYRGSSLDRFRSFREGVENRLCSSEVGASGESGLLMGSLPSLPQCLMLEPFIMGDQKYTRTGELRRVLGCSMGTASEENYFGATNRPLVATEELKRYKESVIDSNRKARGRTKKLDEHLHKLNKYFEVVNCKKHQSNELSTNERSGGLNLRMGNQLRNPPDIITQGEEDWAKNLVPNKRVRTSLSETRAECRSNGLARQPLVMAKERDMLKDGSGSDLVEEKLRKLPTGGEGWDQKMKRKRSMGPTCMRPVNTEGQLKLSVYHKGSNESGLQSCDARAFRSGSSNAISGTNKLDGGPLPGCSFARTMLKNGEEKANLMRDFTGGLNKDKLLAKGNNKLPIREDNHIVNSSPVTKGKASRAPRGGSVTVANSSPNIPSVSEAHENWEQPASATKIHSIGGGDIRKRALSSASSSPPMAQWVGQRQQKSSRTRRANLMCPVSNHEERQISSAGCSPSDFSSGINSSGMNDQHPFRGMANGTQQIKVKLVTVPSPARFSESEESGAGENRSKEKATGSDIVEDKIVCAAQNDGPVILTKKNKSVNKEEFTASVRRQGRGGRGSSFSTPCISPLREKVESTTTAKPLQSTRPGSDKHRSKTGRPLKKQLDRKGFSRRGNMPQNGSPDFTGESEDDREELLSAAKLARNTSYQACSSSFWKKMEPIFSSVSLQDRLYVAQQEEISGSDETFGSGGIDKGLQNQNDSNESAKMMEFIYKFGEFDPLYGKLESEKRLNEVIPLYQRVLSALIVEDEIEEVEENSIGRSLSLQYASNDLPCEAFPRKRGRMDFEHKSTCGAQTWKQGTGSGFGSSNGSDTSTGNTLIHNPPQNELLQGECGFAYLELGVLAGLSGNDIDGPQTVRTNGWAISSFNSPYEKMCIEDKLLLELQSIGLCLDALPDLDDREEEGTNQEIVQLRNVLYQQIDKKKVCVEKVYKSSPQGKEAEAREREQVAMDRLVELAFKKILATRGNIAAKFEIPKVSKQVALAFAKRTIARCQAFEDSGRSCFTEPPLRDVLFAVTPLIDEAEPSTCDDLGVGSFDRMAKRHDHLRGSLDASENLAHQSDKAFPKSGRISNRWKKKEVLLDDVGGNSALRPPSTLLPSTLLGGLKGKRSERDRDKDISRRNPNAKSGQPLCRGERRAKTKPKQKTAQLSTSGSGFGDKITEVGLTGRGTICQDALNESKEAVNFTNLQLPEIEELGVGNDLGHPDLFSWLNIDEDGLHDHDSVGLAIPMDDLSALF